MVQPLVSVVISAYNSAAYVNRCINCLLKQTYQNIEIIFVDSGSTDNTKELLIQFKDERIKYFYQENSPQGVARNYGIQLSKGDYITFLDTDDQFLPEKIEKQLKFLQKHPEYQIAYCGALHYYTNKPDVILERINKQLPSGDIFPHLLHSSLINPNALLIPKAIFENKALLFKEEREGRYAEEWALLLNIARAGYHFGFVAEDLVLVEIREDSHTQWNIQWIMKETALNMITTIFNQMNTHEKLKHNIYKVLQKHNIKLIIAFYIGKSRKEFLKFITTRYSKNKLLTLAASLLILIPKKVIISMWKLKQRKTMKSVAIK